MKRLCCTVMLVLLPGCEDAFECVNCDAGTPAPSDAGVTGRNVVVATPLVLDTRSISNGLANVTIEVRSPPNMDVPSGIAGTFLPATPADLQVSVAVKYNQALLGAAAAGQLVPYLRVDVAVTNMDTLQGVTLALAPVVSLDQGIRYARNLALKETLGSAQSNYSMVVTIRRPSWLGDPDGEAFSTGVVRDADVVGQEAGTLLGERATSIRTHFSLDDLLAASAPTTVPGTPGGASSGGGGYIAP